MGLQPTHTDASPPTCHSECYMGLRPTNRHEKSRWMALLKTNDLRSTFEGAQRRGICLWGGQEEADSSLRSE